MHRRRARCRSFSKPCRGSSSPRQGDDLIVVTGTNRLIEVVERVVELLLKKNRLQRQVALQRQRTAAGLRAGAERRERDIVLARLRYAADLPARGQLDGDLVRVLIGETEVHGMHARGVLESVLLPSTE